MDFVGDILNYTRANTTNYLSEGKPAEAFFGEFNLLIGLSLFVGVMLMVAMGLVYMKTRSLTVTSLIMLLFGSVGSTASALFLPAEILAVMFVFVVLNIGGLVVGVLFEKQ